MEELLNVSPLDGRYKEYTEELSAYWSEFALIKARVSIEIDWLSFLMRKGIVTVTKIEEVEDLFKEIVYGFDVKEAALVKKHEAVTNHDVKAVEYYLREKFVTPASKKLIPYIHFLLTSEDINSTAYAILIKECVSSTYLPTLNALIEKLNELAEEYSDTPMLAHTHGQPATPTTVGKEFKVFAYRLESLYKKIENAEVKAKFSGTVGNYSAHKLAYPSLNWPVLAEDFIESFGLSFNPITTQIEPHDDLCALLSLIKVANNIINDLDNDMWLYICLGYFSEKKKDGEVGSSVMPHKVNPINYENSMANCQLSNGMVDALVNNLSMSRMQRDLSDSSKLRNIGVVFGYSLIAMKQTLKGLNKVMVNGSVLEKDLEENWVVLAEAIQTILRKNNVSDAYEQLKALSRGHKVSKEEMTKFIESLDIEAEDKKALLALSPEKYTGFAKDLAKSK